MSIKQTFFGNVNDNMIVVAIKPDESNENNIVIEQIGTKCSEFQKPTVFIGDKNKTFQTDITNLIGGKKQKKSNKSKKSKKSSKKTRKARRK